jgi:predicted MPP superfamily phosphohydrolase
VRTPSRRDLLKTLLTAAAGAAAGAGAYGFVYERHRIQLTSAPFPVPNLPPALQGLRVGLLTDIHYGTFVPADDVETASRLLLAARPDLIVLGGDFVTWRDRRQIGPCVEVLSQLNAPHGIFAVLGNHDDETATPPALHARGVEVLRDERTRIVIRKQPLELVGIRYWTRQLREIRPVLRGARGPVLLLAHDPRRLTEASSLGIPAVLSGHTHGGQVVLPLVGALAARRFPVVAGLGRLGDTAIWVSRGLGTVFLPVRVNCPPEVALLTLEPT